MQLPFELIRVGDRVSVTPVLAHETDRIWRYGALIADLENKGRRVMTTSDLSRVTSLFMLQGHILQSVRGGLVSNLRLFLTMEELRLPSSRASFDAQFRAMAIDRTEYAGRSWSRVDYLSERKNKIRLLAFHLGLRPLVQTYRRHVSGCRDEYLQFWWSRGISGGTLRCYLGFELGDAEFSILSVNTTE
ncbi:hypothetical protein [Luteimonas deserti]|uniref:Uncharacterized protein n=1 Tax=Luteimonas deserti TaxID=2752306 RepID=A0A7Z0QNS8_9GAMM|nr:hypothetical protein [Luteimonas deserti]NYZ62019.1 hypothetical protein [Luteimonas deserti]